MYIQYPWAVVFLRHFEWVVQGLYDASDTADQQLIKLQSPAVHFALYRHTHTHACAYSATCVRVPCVSARMHVFCLTVDRPVDKVSY